MSDYNTAMMREHRCSVAAEPKMPHVKDRKFYDLLGVFPNADASAIKRAYRKRALQYHPDKNLDDEEQAKEKFRQLSLAFQILDDPYRRKLYDAYGEDLAPPNGTDKSNNNTDDYAARMFERFFGGQEMYGGSFAPGMRRGRDVHHKHRVALEDLYNGKTSKLALQKSVVCSECKGFGGKQECVRKCEDCGGRGTTISNIEVAPGILQRASKFCESCQGDGEIIDEEGRCTLCLGRKTITERKVLQVVIEKGMRNGQKIVFRGEGDQQPGIAPGDIIVVIDEKEHPVFKRDQNDLSMTMEIELVEALCGFRRAVTHLDGRIIAINCPPGDVTHDGAVKCVYGEGMPIFKNPSERGRLLITFRVKYPKDGFIDSQGLSLLESVLPPRPPFGDGEPQEEHNLHPLDHRESQTWNLDEDQHTQCRSQ